MITKFKIKKSISIFFASLILACGAEALIFIPIFAATWNVQGNDDYRIDLQPDAANKNVHAGVFKGREEHDFNNTKRDSLFGSFDGLNIEFFIRRPSGNVQYTGTMTPISDKDHNIMRIDLTSSEGSLILEQ